jgi:hypothetical protein
LQPTNNCSSAEIRTLASRYGARLKAVAEWALGDGARLQIRTAIDLLVGLALVRDRLGINVVDLTETTRRSGPSKQERLDRGLVQQSVPLSEDQLVSLFQLIPITENGSP